MVSASLCGCVYIYNSCIELLTLTQEQKHNAAKPSIEKIFRGCEAENGSGIIPF